MRKPCLRCGAAVRFPHLWWCQACHLEMWREAKRIEYRSPKPEDEKAQ